MCAASVRFEMVFRFLFFVVFHTRRPHRIQIHAPRREAFAAFRILQGFLYAFLVFPLTLSERLRARSCGTVPFSVFARLNYT